VKDYSLGRFFNQLERK